MDMFHYQQQAAMDHRMVASGHGHESGPLAFVAAQLPNQPLPPSAYSPQLQQQPHLQHHQPVHQMPSQVFVDPHGMHHAAMAEQAYGYPGHHSNPEQGAMPAPYSAGTVPYPQLVDHNHADAAAIHRFNASASYGYPSPEDSAMYLAKRPLEPATSFPYAYEGSHFEGSKRLRFSHSGHSTGALSMPPDSRPSSSAFSGLLAPPVPPTAVPGASTPLPFPSRPGQTACAFYLKTGTCKFGATCKFDHPSLPLTSSASSPGVAPGNNGTVPARLAGDYPLRPGEPKCAFFLRTGTCKFGASCKFDHPPPEPSSRAAPADMAPQEAAPEGRREQPGSAASEGDGHGPDADGAADAALHHPQGEAPSAAQWARTSSAIDLASAAAVSASVAQAALGSIDDGPLAAPLRGGRVAGGAAAGPAGAPAADRGFLLPAGLPGSAAAGGSAAYPAAAALNSRGLPLRPEELDCAFYMKCGSCKFGATCKFNHPELLGGSARYLPSGRSDDNADVWMLPAGPRLHSLPSHSPYPERPGQPDCAYYMKTGLCKFGSDCRFHHPRVRQVAAPSSAHASLTSSSAPAASPLFLRASGPTAPAPGVKLTAAGLPRREVEGEGGKVCKANLDLGQYLWKGEVECAYYMKTGTCRYGATCKFDHPPPGEAAARAAALAAKERERQQQQQQQQLPLPVLPLPASEVVEEGAAGAAPGQTQGASPGPSGAVVASAAADAVGEEGLPGREKVAEADVHEL